MKPCGKQEHNKLRLIYIAVNPVFLKWGYMTRWIRSVLATHAIPDLDSIFEPLTEIPSENSKFFYPLLIFTIVISEGFD